MQCHECGRAVQVGDRFCNGCGISLSGVTEPTETIPTLEADARADATAEADDATAEVDVAAGGAAADDGGVPNGPVDDAASESVPATSELPSTELLEQVAGDAWDDDDPVWAVTGAVPETFPSTGDTTSGVASGVTSDAVSGTTSDVATGDLPTTEPITEVWMDPVESAPAESAPVTAATPVADAPATAAMPVTPTPVAAGPRVPDHRFRFSLVTLLGLVGGVAILVAVFATVLEITSSDPITIDDDAPAAFRLGTWIADDLADNLSVAGLVAALAMVLGGVAASFGWRWGSGLAGGGGLAAAGLAALVIGLAQFPIDAAHEFAAIPTDQQFTLTITKALGYWLLVAAGAIGVVVFFASTNDAFSDRRDGLNPWIAALGALAVVIATAGPLLPEGSAVFSDNWYVIERTGEPPAMLVAMRLVQLGLFALGGVIGFLSVRRWGLGVAAGATLPGVWLGVSTLFEIGDGPVGPGYRNPGASSAELHGVTIIGLSAILGMAVLGAVAAYDQSVRSRP